MRFLVPLALTLALVPTAASAQACDSETYSNGLCDCGCGTVDPECPTGANFTLCQSNQCAAGQVPQRATPKSCSPTSCGDGWKDPRVDEACDDGDTLATGGCSATCEAITSGYLCGAFATGCAGDPNAEGTPDAGAPSDGGTSSDAGTGGGSGTGGGGGTGGGSGTGGGGATGGGSATGAGTGNTKPPPSSEPISTGCTTTGGALLGFAALAWLSRRRR